MITGGTLLTIYGVNFSAPTTVLIGGQSATNVTVSSSSQITCFTPPSSTNGSVPVVVQTSGGSATNQNGFAYGITRGNKLDLISATGGSCFAVAVQGNYAYIGEGRNLLVLNVSTPSSPAKVGQVTLPGIINDVALFGQDAYVADGEGGLQVVDISNPTTPVIRGFYLTTNYTWAAGITIFGGRAYLTDENINVGLEIFDLGNPIMPTLLSSIPCGGGAYDVVVKASTNGVFAYVSSGSSLCAVNVSNPLSPVLRGQASIGTAYSIALSGNHVFCASWFGNVEMVDVSNPDALAVVGNAPDIYAPVAVAAVNNIVYAVAYCTGYRFYAFIVSGNTLSTIGNIPSVYSTESGTKIVDR